MEYLKTFASTEIFKTSLSFPSQESWLGNSDLKFSPSSTLASNCLHQCNCLEEIWNLAAESVERILERRRLWNFDPERDSTLSKASMFIDTWKLRCSLKWWRKRQHLDNCAWRFRIDEVIKNLVPFTELLNGFLLIWCRFTNVPCI